MIAATTTPQQRRSPSPNHRLRGWLSDAYVILAAAASLALLVNALPPIHRTLANVGPPDFVADYRAATAYHDGYNPYSPAGAVRSSLNKSGETGFGHPPTTAFWALPLTRYDLRTANATLGWTNLLLLLCELLTLALIYRWPFALPTAFLLFSYLLSCTFMLYHMSVGQWSQSIGFLYFAAWLSLRRERDELAGLCLGAACTLKLFPGVVVLFLLVARRFRAAAVAVAVYLAIAAIMTARFGLDSWRVFLRAQSGIANNWLDNIQNESIHGIVMRLFFPSCGPRAGHVSPAATAVSTAIALSVLASVLWAVRSRARLARSFDLAYASFVVLSLFSSQWTWEHYNVILVFPLAVLLGHVAWLRRQPGKSRWAALSVVVAAGTLASWALSIHEKISLQPLVQAGDHSQHWRLHFLEVANWLPSVCLLAILVRVLYLRSAEDNEGLIPLTKLGEIS